MVVCNEVTEISFSVEIYSTNVFFKSLVLLTYSLITYIIIRAI